jgi:hypothetical protein
VEEHHDRREPHDRAVAGSARISRARKRVLRAAIATERRADRVADVETPAIARGVSLVHPATVAIHLIARIEALAFDEADRKAERHRGVVGPLAGIQPERSTARHIGHRSK